MEQQSSPTKTTPSSPTDHYISKLEDCASDYLCVPCQTQSFRRSGWADRQKMEGNLQPFHRLGLQVPTSPQLCCSPEGVRNRKDSLICQKAVGWCLGLTITTPNYPGTSEAKDW